jgi:hypothetical protein
MCVIPISPPRSTRQRPPLLHGRALGLTFIVRFTLAEFGYQSGVYDRQPVGTVTMAIRRLRQFSKLMFTSLLTSLSTLGVLPQLVMLSLYTIIPLQETLPRSY